MRRVMRLTALAAMLYALPAVAEDLLVQGDTYKPACDAERWEVTATALRKAADGRQEKALEGLVHAWLCEKGDAALHKLWRAAPAKIRVEEASTGDEGSTTLTPREEAISLREGASWGVTVDNQSAELTISIYSDEACMEFLGFRFTGGKWMVIRKAQACD